MNIFRFFRLRSRCGQPKANHKGVIEFPASVDMRRIAELAQQNPAEPGYSVEQARDDVHHLRIRELLPTVQDPAAREILQLMAIGIRARTIWPDPVDLNLEFMDGRIVPMNPKAEPRIFEPTHVHVSTGKQFMLTSIGERIELTGDDGFPLAEYEDAEGNRYAQWSERFLDGRFLELPL